MKKLSILLIIVGLALAIVFTGQNYNGFLLIFAGLLILLFGHVGRKARRIISAVLAIGIVYFIAVEIPIIKGSCGDTGENADYLIILGAAIYGETPSLSMVERCDAAIAYLNDNPDCIAVVSGGQGYDEIVSEAEIMKRLLLDGGISEDRIIVENKSFSTYENIQNSKALIDKPNAVLAVCTSEYHIFRAKLIGSSMGLDLLGVPARTTHVSVRCNYFIREAFGVTYQLITG